MKKELMSIILLIFLFPIISAASCSIVEKASCENYTIMGLSSVTNAHGELASQNNYDYGLCCDFGTGNTTCTGTNKIIGLSSVTNAHAEATNLDNYEYDICYEDISCETAVECDTNQTSIMSLSNITNAHIGGPNDYSIKVCCEAIIAPEPSDEIAFWADSNKKPITKYKIVPDSTQLTMIFNNLGLAPGTQVNFTIMESDLGVDDTIKVLSSSIKEDGSAEVTWLVTTEDLEKGASDVLLDENSIYELGEFYFEVDGEPSGILEIEIIDQRDFCSPISFCRDYTEQTDCEADICGVSNESVENNYGGNICGEVFSDDECEVWSNCNCQWYEGVCEPVKEDHLNCSDGNPTVIGRCLYKENSSDDCEDGYLEYSWIGIYSWDDENIFDSEKAGAEGYVEEPTGVWHYDPQGKGNSCTGGSNLIQCPVSALLPFFSLFNIIFILIIIGIVYYFISKNKKTKRRKKSGKKKSKR